MSRSTLSGRGPYATTPAKLPGLQGMRSSDPQTQRSLEALREWVEVRLGSRGDKYESAVTLREFDQWLEPIRKKIAELSGFTGDISTLRAQVFSALPSTVTRGAFILLDTDELYVGTSTEWRQVTLAS